MTEQLAQQILARLERMETMLGLLLKALAEDDEDPPARGLDGDELPRERDQTQSLG